MPHINVNFDEVPDGFEAIPTGVYNCHIEGTPTLEPAKKGGTNLVIQLVVDEGEFAGRKFRDYIFQNEAGRVSMKQLCAAFDVPVGAMGVDTEDLAGKSGLVGVIADSYKNKLGITRQTSKVDCYLTAPPEETEAEATA